MIDERRHMARLDRSLGELRIARPMSSAALGVVLRETIRRNRVHNGIVYVQVTRGVAKRDFPFPTAGTRPSLVVTARSNDPERLEQRLDKRSILDGLSGLKKARLWEVYEATHAEIAGELADQLHFLGLGELVLEAFVLGGLDRVDDGGFVVAGVRLA
jgi:branched-subunit amino acid aminotransferase/4-amino-4-deoxychorismate lyase